MEAFLHCALENDDITYKLKSSMYLLLDPKAKINHNYLNQLLKILTSDDDSLDFLRLEEDFVIDWFKIAVETWSSSNIYVPKNVLSFTANLVSSFIKKEKFFTKLQSTSIFLERCIDIMRAVPEPRQFSQIKISYTKLLSSIIHHDSGLDWLMQTSYWFDLITMASHGSRAELEKQSFAVLLHMLEYSNRYNEAFCKKVVKTILTPIEDLAVSAINDNDTSLLEISEMKETLDFVKNILTNILKRSSESRKFNVLSIFVEQNNLEKELSDIISVVDKENSLLLLSTILGIVLFCQLSISFRKKLSLQCAAIIQKIDNLIIYVLEKCKPYNKFFTIIECGFMLGNYIFEVPTNMHINHIVEDIETFQNQLLIYLIWPLFDTATKVNVNRKEKIENEEFRQKFFSKLFKIIQPATYKTVKRLKAFVNNMTIEDSTKVLECVQKCLPSIQHNVANTITQVLIYNFSDMLNTMSATQIIQIWTQDLIGLYIDTLILLLRTFDLTLKDSVETVYVTDTAIHFLEQPCWAPKLVAKGLDLLDVAVSKCLSPNMALLLNKETDSQIRDLEDIILKHTRSQCWEIRCMALQIIGTVARMAKNNFESYQTMLIKARLPRLVMNISLNDANCQVKVKGLQSLQEIIKVEELWCNLTKIENIHDQLLKNFYLQQEGIVRSEALVLLKVIFEEQKLPEMFKEKIYDCMIFAILQDDQKLVKLKALSFWDLVIKKELEHEGMIDGSFPTVTFSKVLKKIITFDDSTVEGCLLRVLYRLNEIGGLYAFIHIFENENDYDLFNPDIVYIHKFVELLIKHNITSSSYMNSENAFYPSSDNNHFEETEANFISELLDLETNRILRYPKQGLSSAKKNNQIGFWGFIRALDHFSNKRAKKNGSSEDLATVLANVFTD